MVCQQSLILDVKRKLHISAYQDTHHQAANERMQKGNIYD
jgi:hypothetical protein